jgi:hypothetical protein
MKKIILLGTIGLLILATLAFGQEIYRWVDEKGTIHFADDLSLVPERYQDQIQKEKSPKEPITPSIGIPKNMKGKEEPKSALQQKDLLGRGEEWWRAKMQEWSDKLLNAQESYETAYNAWKTKERELEESKFKPDSLKRRLKAEIKDLEEKAKGWEKQMEEAKNMLEKVLPKQAEDYRANPDWLKIEQKK